MTSTPSNKEKLSPDEKRRLLAEILEKRKSQSGKFAGPVARRNANAGQTTSAGISSMTLDEGANALATQAKWHVDIREENPFFRVFDGPMLPQMQSGDATVTNFSGYDYLGLSCDKRVQDAACEAIQRLGSSVAASRIASGERPIHRQLEQSIAGFLGTEDALVMVSGFGTNESVIGHIAGPGDLILYDMYMHRSAIEGARLSGADRMPFPHNDMAALEQLIKDHRANYNRCFVLVEGIYSMDGDSVDLAQLVKLKKRHDLFLFVDEAHSFGVLGDTGRGIVEHCGVDRADIDITMGTLSKSLASCGGFIAGEMLLIRYLRYSTPGFIYSVGLSPANSAAALKSVEILRSEPERSANVKANGRRFYERLKSHGLDTGFSEGFAVTPVVVGSSENSVRLSNRLFERGVNAQTIYFPAVPEEFARLRFFITQSHTNQQLDEAADLVAATSKEVCGS
jgi:8-amino-7-oxononanoate synthase